MNWFKKHWLLTLILIGTAFYLYQLQVQKKAGEAVGTMAANILNWLGGGT